MSIPRTTKTAVQDKPYSGFNELGGHFHSTRPIDNAITRFIPDLLSQVRTKFLSPADVEMIVRIQPAWVRSAFPNIEQWSKWGRAWQWFAPPASTSAEETVKRGGHPDERSDPNAYEHWLEEAERFHGYECRFTHVHPGGIHTFGVNLALPESLRLECRVHGLVLPRS